jgi:hypothetical protein
MYKQEGAGLMESQTKCNDTTSENTPRTLEKGSQAKRKYTLSDLNRLTFQLEGVEQTLDVETCTPEQFNVFISEMVEVEDVDVNVWPLEVRRDLVNDLYDFCLTNGYEFPLTDVKVEAAPEAV